MPIITFIGIMLVFFGMVIFCHYQESCDQCAGKISYDYFMKQYYSWGLDWTLHGGYVTLNIARPPYGEYDLCFSFFDYIRYQLWRWRENKEEKARESTKKMQVVYSYLNGEDENA